MSTSGAGRGGMCMMWNDDEFDFDGDDEENDVDDGTE